MPQPSPASVKKLYDEAITTLECFKKTIRRLSETARPFARRAVENARKNCDLYLSISQDPELTDRAIKRLKHGQSEQTLRIIDDVAFLISLHRKSDEETGESNRFAVAETLLTKKIMEIHKFEKRY